MGVASRDVKPENILLDGKGEVKLADFGFSKDDEAHSAAKSKLGSLDYVAPELAALAPGASYDARKADVWACGVVLFEMVAGRPPWQRPSDEPLKHMQRALAVQARYDVEHVMNSSRARAGEAELVDYWLTKPLEARPAPARHQRRARLAKLYTSLRAPPSFPRAPTSTTPLPMSITCFSRRVRRSCLGAQRSPPAAVVRRARTSTV
jgi:serine/threonine protein kinase